MPDTEARTYSRRQMAHLLDATVQKIDDSLLRMQQIQAILKTHPEADGSWLRRLWWRFLRMVGV